MRTDMRVSGLDGALTLLEAVREAALLDAAQDGLGEGLDAICAQARLLCPRDTGALAASIGVRLTQEDGTLSGEVYAGAPYAVPVEMGTFGRAAQPFLYPAMTAQRQSVVGDVASSVTRQMGRRG